MEYQKIKNLLDKTPNQPSKFRTKNWVEINDDSRGLHNTNSQIKFKTSMMKSSVFYYNDAYKIASGTITVVGAGADMQQQSHIKIIKKQYLKNVQSLPAGLPN